MKVYKMQLAGRELSFETGRIAKQVSGAVLICMAILYCYVQLRHRQNS